MQVNSGQFDILWNFAGNKIHANMAFDDIILYIHDYVYSNRDVMMHCSLKMENFTVWSHVKYRSLCIRRGVCVELFSKLGIC